MELKPNGVDVKTFKLCYVYENFAYFTSQELSKQWGDDWNDAPYEHNAGCPYLPHGEPEETSWEIIKVAFYGNLVQPCEGHLNRSFSVEQINQGHIAWLRDAYGSSGVSIQAGVDIPTFIALVEKSGGRIYTCHND